MNEVPEFPDVMAWLEGYLSDVLPRNGYGSVHVSQKYRGDQIEVWLQRDGGAVTDVRDFARVRVNVFHDGEDSGPVDRFAQRVSSLVRASVGSGPVRRAALVSGPLPVDGIKPRRYLLFEFVVRGESFTPA